MYNRTGHVSLLFWHLLCKSMLMEHFIHNTIIKTLPRKPSSSCAHMFSLCVFICSYRLRSFSSFVQREKGSFCGWYLALKSNFWHCYEVILCYESLLSSLCSSVTNELWCNILDNKIWWKAHSSNKIIEENNMVHAYHQNQSSQWHRFSEFYFSMFLFFTASWFFLWGMRRCFPSGSEQRDPSL